MAAPFAAAAPPGFIPFRPTVSPAQVGLQPQPLLPGGRRSPLPPPAPGMPGALGRISPLWSHPNLNPALFTCEPRHPLPRKALSAGFTLTARLPPFCPAANMSSGSSTPNRLSGEGDGFILNGVPQPRISRTSRENERPPEFNAGVPPSRRSREYERHDFGTDISPAPSKNAHVDRHRLPVHTMPGHMFRAKSPKEKRELVREAITGVPEYGRAWSPRESSDLKPKVVPGTAWQPPPGSPAARALPATGGFAAGGFTALAMPVGDPSAQAMFPTQSPAPSASGSAATGASSDPVDPAPSAAATAPAVLGVAAPVGPGTGDQATVLMLQQQLTALRQEVAAQKVRRQAGPSRFAQEAGAATR